MCVAVSCVVTAVNLSGGGEVSGVYRDPAAVASGPSSVLLGADVVSLVPAAVDGRVPIR